MLSNFIHCFHSDVSNLSRYHNFEMFLKSGCSYISVETTVAFGGGPLPYALRSAANDMLDNLAFKSAKSQTQFGKFSIPSGQFQGGL